MVLNLEILHRFWMNQTKLKFTLTPLPKALKITFSTLTHPKGHPDPIIYQIYYHSLELKNKKIIKELLFFYLEEQNGYFLQNLESLSIGNI